MTAVISDVVSLRMAYTWNGQNKNLSESLAEAPVLAKYMWEISKTNLYASSLSQYENFCVQCLCQPFQSACFCAAFVLLYQEIIVAFLNVRIAFSDAEIDFICVDPQYRRKGFAEKLFQDFYHFATENRQIQRILLEVGIENAPAIAFYEKLGFQKTFCRKKYYSHGEDALVMELAIA